MVQEGESLEDVQQFLDNMSARLDRRGMLASVHKTADLAKIKQQVYKRITSWNKPLLNTMRYWKLFPKQVKKWLIYTRTPKVRHNKHSHLPPQNL